MRIGTVCPPGTHECVFPPIHAPDTPPSPGNSHRLFALLNPHGAHGKYEVSWAQLKEQKSFEVA